MSPTVLGTIAACLTTGSWIPQIVRTYRFRSALDLSWPWLWSVALGQAMWLAYGLSETDGPLIAANGLSLTFVLGLCACKLLSDRTRPAVAEEPVKSRRP